MQFRNILAVLFFFIVNICLASADYDVVFVTMTTEVEVTSTVVMDTVTMTGRPETTQEPDYVPLTTLYPNSTLVEPTATGSPNGTAHSSSVPTKGAESSANGVSGSIHVAVVAGAIVAVLGML